jgi:hypothetical protein
MATDERIENQESRLARIKRRNRWVLAVVILAVVGLQGGLFDPAAPEVPEVNVRQSVPSATGLAFDIAALSRPATSEVVASKPPITAREMWDRNMARAIPVLGKAMQWYDIHRMKNIIDKAAVGEASKMEKRELDGYRQWQDELVHPYYRGTTYGADAVKFSIAICPWAMLVLGGWALIHHMHKRRLV